MTPTVDVSRGGDEAALFKPPDCFWVLAHFFGNFGDQHVPGPLFENLILPYDSFTLT